MSFCHESRERATEGAREAGRQERRHVGVSVSLMFGVFVFLRPRYVIIMAAIVEWAHKAKSRPHITESVCSQKTV